MNQGHVVAIGIAGAAGEPLISVQEVMALAGQGLEGDRYSRGEGSFNRGRIGSRQVSLINSLFVRGTTFKYPETRRNIATYGVELMDLIGKEFEIGEARFKGIKYCDPCTRPSELANKPQVFRDAFSDRGGLIAEVLRSGVIAVRSAIIPPKKAY